MPVINPMYTTQPGQPQPPFQTSQQQQNMQPPPVVPVMQTQANSFPPQQHAAPAAGATFPAQFPQAASVGSLGSQQQPQVAPPVSTNPFFTTMNLTPTPPQPSTGGIYTSSSSRYPNPMLPPQLPVQQQQQPQQNQYVQQQQSPYPTPAPAPQRPQGNYVISGQPVNPSNLYPSIPSAVTNNNYPQVPLGPQQQPSVQHPPGAGGGGLSLNSHHHNSYPHPQHNQHSYNNGGVAQISAGMNNMSIAQQGFNKLWGIDHADLLKTRQILPPDGVKPPEVRFQHEYMNHVNCSPEYVFSIFNLLEIK